jgi:hypothetical protein
LPRKAAVSGYRGTSGGKGRPRCVRRVVRGGEWVVRGGEWVVRGAGDRWEIASGARRSDGDPPEGHSENFCPRYGRCYILPMSVPSGRASSRVPGCSSWVRGHATLALPGAWTANACGCITQ